MKISSSILLEGMENALHGFILWRKDNIKLIGNTAAPVDPRFLPDCDNDDRGSSPEPPSAPSPPGDPRSLPDTVNDDRNPSPQPPSASSPPGERARSTPTPPASEKGKKKTSPLPPAGPTNKKQKTIEKKISPKKHWLTRNWLTR